MQADLLVYNAGQLLTVASNGPQAGLEAGRLGIRRDGAVAIRDGRITKVGSSGELRSEVEALQVLDASGRVVMPGFVDPHTHLVFAGSRVNEFEMRLAGATYLEIMTAGGGIMSTVRAVREASDGELLAQSRARADDMLLYGTTTSEVKTGYGLSTADELKCLRVIQRLDRTHPIDLVPTFLGAHAVPEEYRDRADDYVELVIQEMLPAVAAHAGLARFCDVFCDAGAFTLEQARRVLAAAQALGLGLKIHADEFVALGAAKMAAELGAISADHLVRTPRDEMGALARAGTIAVLLPGTPFGLGEREFARARDWLQAGAAVALATDLNPGTCPCSSMPFIIALGCRYMGLTPAQAIVAATLNAAYAIGRGAEVGSIEPGKVADLIVLDAYDYRDLAYRFGGNLVAGVIKAGEVVVCRGRRHSGRDHSCVSETGFD